MRPTTRPVPAQTVGATPALTELLPSGAGSVAPALSMEQMGEAGAAGVTRPPVRERVVLRSNLGPRLQEVASREDHRHSFQTRIPRTTPTTSTPVVVGAARRGPVATHTGPSVATSVEPVVQAWPARSRVRRASTLAVEVGDPQLELLQVEAALVETAATLEPADPRFSLQRPAQPAQVPVAAVAGTAELGALEPQAWSSSDTAHHRPSRPPALTLLHLPGSSLWDAPAEKMRVPLAGLRLGRSG